jgi:sigma-54 dependent transcriptional regulator, acetoin dehydrogenase operon transcriptional activator AcoR
VVETLTTNESTSPQAGVAMLFAVLRAAEPLAPSSRHVLHGIDEVEIRRGEAPAVERGERLVLHHADPWLSSVHGRLRCQRGVWSLEDAGSKNGVFRNGVRVDRAALADGDVLEMGHSFFVFRAAQAHVQALDVSAQQLAPQAHGMSSLSSTLAARFSEVTRAAGASLPVVIQGESGTGKELIARAVHALSGRRGQLVAVNCGALPRTLIESELFGFKKGSFSGAQQDKPGLVAASDGGTLFLDEIAELPLESQAVLLRVLQEREVLPIGATQPQRIDLRVVCATHRDLDAEVAGGRFRADLHARLSGFTLRLPALRERREDMGLLVSALLERLAPGRALVFSHAAARALFTRSWPGNVRELERALELSTVMASGTTLELAEAPPAQRPIGMAGGTAGGTAGESSAPVEAEAQLPAADRERRARLEGLLREHRGNVTHVARAMGAAREQVYRWIKRLGLDAKAFRP